MYLIISPSDMMLLYKVNTLNTACGLLCLRNDIHQHVFEVSQPFDLMIYSQFELNMLYRNITDKELTTTLTHEANAETVYNVLTQLQADEINFYYLDKQTEYSCEHDGSFVYLKDKVKPKLIEDQQVDDKFKFHPQPGSEIKTASFKRKLPTKPPTHNVLPTIAGDSSEKPQKPRTPAPSAPGNWPKEGTDGFVIWSKCEEAWSKAGLELNKANLREVKFSIRDQLVALGINAGTISVQSNKWVRFKLI